MSLINLKIHQQPIEYSIEIGDDTISSIQSKVSKLGNYNRYIIFYDKNIDKLFIDQLTQHLTVTNITLHIIPLNSDHNLKSLTSFEKIHKQLLNLECDKDSLLISMGGGSIGDIIGFIASNFYRGVDYIQIPSTLLSMLDSSIGGKTGLDSYEGKNLIGSFYHPRRVIIDIRLLSSLPDDEINSGLFEAIKYAILYSEELFSFIENNLNKIRDPGIIYQLIYECCLIKSQIVEKDQKDSDERKKLNFGHTIGHAIESLYKLRHGESVGYGMLSAIFISKQLGTLSDHSYSKILSLINRLSLPPIHANPNLIINQLSKDKKIKNDLVNFILLNGIGNSYISNKVDENIIRSSILNL